MIKFLPKLILLTLSCITITSCSSEAEHSSTRFTGDYRYYAGISEIFDCATGKRYFLGKQGITKEVEEKFLALKLKAKEDTFIEIEGYLEEESPDEAYSPQSYLYLPNLSVLMPTEAAKKRTVHHNSSPIYDA